MKTLKLLFCGLLLAATPAVDAEIIKNLDFYESYELLEDESFVLDQQLEEVQSETPHE